jgi:hypothetical protein
MDNKMKKILCLTLAILCGCQTESEIQRENQMHFNSGGEFVGEINGKKVVRYTVDNGMNPSHYIYTIDGENSITVNRSVSSGKSSHIEADFIIDGNGQKWQKVKE